MIVKATNVVDADTEYGVTFSISPLLNPSSTEPQGSIDITAMKDGTRSVGACSGNKITGVTAGTVDSPTYVVEDYEVNADSTAYISFQVDTVIVSTD